MYDICFNKDWIYKKWIKNTKVRLKNNKMNRLICKRIRRDSKTRRRGLLNIEETKLDTIYDDK